MGTPSFIGSRLKITEEIDKRAEKLAFNANYDHILYLIILLLNNIKLKLVYYVKKSKWKQFIN